MAENNNERFVDEVINSDQWSESEKSEFLDMAVEEEKKAKQQKLEQPQNDVETDENAKLKEEIEKFNQEFPDHKLDRLPDGATAEQIKAVRDQMEAVRKDDKTSENSSDGKTEDGKSPAKDSMKVEDKEKAETNRDSLSISNDNGQEPDWIKEKREFWQKYAQDNQYGLVNDVEKDMQEKAFTGRLAKDGKELGEIKYTSKTAATISKDSSIELYQGLVKDAMANELSVTFGNSLDDKQKAMLFAACLMNKDKYKDGTELAMVNPPKIDLNAEYFKELPDNVKKVLTDHVKAAEQKETGAKDQGNAKISPDTLKALREKVAKRIATGQGADGKPVSDKATAAEKIFAARMGLSQQMTYTSSKENKEVTVTKDEEFRKRVQKNSPEVFAAMQKKYGNNGNS